MPEQRQSAIWFTEEGPRRARLSRERITRAAVQVLDVEGVAGLSMRRLAARLEVSPMSLYEYVGSKEDVLDLAVDEVIAEIELDDAEDVRWREELVRRLGQSRQVMNRHPWLPALMATRPLLGPNSLARSERVYSLLEKAGLEGPQLVAAVGSLTYYVQGYAAAENVWRSSHHDPGGVAELRGRAQQHIDRQSDRYPALTRHAQLTNDDLDGSFELGLDTILDGIEARLGT